MCDIYQRIRHVARCSKLQRFSGFLQCYSKNVERHLHVQSLIILYHVNRIKTAESKSGGCFPNNIFWRQTCARAAREQPNSILLILHC